MIWAQLLNSPQTAEGNGTEETWGTFSRGASVLGARGICSRHAKLGWNQCKISSLGKLRMLEGWQVSEPQASISAAHIYARYKKHSKEPGTELSTKIISKISSGFQNYLGPRSNFTKPFWFHLSVSSRFSHNLSGGHCNLLSHKNMLLYQCCIQPCKEKYHPIKRSDHTRSLLSHDNGCLESCTLYLSWLGLVPLSRKITKLL